MWDLLGFLTAMTFWWFLTFFGTVLAITYVLRAFARQTEVHEFVRDVDNLCDKVTKLPASEWTGFFVISIILWVVNSFPYYLNLKLDANLWSLSVEMAEKASSYAAWVLFFFAYPVAILLVKAVYKVKPVLAKHKEAMDKISDELNH